MKWNYDGICEKLLPSWCQPKPLLLLGSIIRSYIGLWVKIDILSWNSASWPPLFLPSYYSTYLSKHSTLWNPRYSEKGDLPEQFASTFSLVIFTWIWAYKTHYLTDCQLIIGSSLPVQVISPCALPWRFHPPLSHSLAKPPPRFFVCNSCHVNCSGPLVFNVRSVGRMASPWPPYCSPVPSPPATRRPVSSRSPATAVTNAGLLQATDLRSVDYKAWQPEVLEAIGLYHAYIRWYNR